MAYKTFIGEVPTAYPCPYCTAPVICTDPNTWAGGPHDEGGPYPVWCEACGIAALTHYQGRKRSLRKPTFDEIEMWKETQADVYDEFKWDFIQPLALEGATNVST